MSFRILLAAVAASLVPAGASPAGAADDGWTSVITNGEKPVIGSGRIIRQSRPISAVEAVELAGSSNAEIRVGPAPSLVIEADDNILPLLTSRVRGGTLVLDSKGSYRTRRVPRFTITLPRLAAVATKGSGDVVIGGMNGARLALAINGSGNIRAEGRVQSVDASIRGSGDIDLRGLSTADADAAIYGSGDIQLAATGRVRASTFGSGDITLLRRPASLDTSKAGSGEIRIAGR